MIYARFCYQPKDTVGIFHKCRITVFAVCGLCALGVKSLIVSLLTLQPALGAVRDHERYLLIGPVETERHAVI